MSDNVVSIFSKPKPKGEEEEAHDFADIIARNEANAKRVAADRAKANKSVVRSYKLKPKKDK